MTSSDSKISKNLEDVNSSTEKRNSEDPTQFSLDSSNPFNTDRLTALEKENAELRKKLEFFTEIGEDSKRLNVTEDVAQRNRLLDQALDELGVTSKTAAETTSTAERPKAKAYKRRRVREFGNIAR